MVLPPTPLIPLPRAVIHVTGADAGRFLQGLMSNDIAHLQTQASLYACFLSPQGKFLYESIIINDLQDGFYLDTEDNARAHDLMTHLTRHVLRAHVTLSLVETAQVVAGTLAPAANTLPYPDPRHADLPPRAILLSPSDLQITGSFADWDLTRLKLGVPDGARDAEIGVSTLEELNITHLNGVSFTKGCYVGQELTARMENRGLAKRHLMPVRLTRSDLNPIRGQSIYKNNEIVGELRSRCQDYALALLRDDTVQKAHVPLTLKNHPQGWEVA